MLFNLVFGSDAIFSWFYFFFLIIDLYVLTPAGNVQISNPIAELVIPIGKPTTEAKVEM